MACEDQNMIIEMTGTLAVLRLHQWQQRDSLLKSFSGSFFFLETESLAGFKLMDRRRKLLANVSFFIFLAVKEVRATTQRQISYQMNTWRAWELWLLPGCDIKNILVDVFPDI